MRSARDQIHLVVALGMPSMHDYSESVAMHVRRSTDTAVRRVFDNDPWHAAVLNACYAALSPSDPSIP